jgi:hypothetical protein
VEVILEGPLWSLFNYRYQISDGVQAAVSVLSILMENYPERKAKAKTILLLTLFNEFPVDMAGTGLNAFAISAIHSLWKTSFNDAQSLLLGYLFLKPRWDNLREEKRKEAYKRKVYDLSETQVMDAFLKENGGYLDKIINNQISSADIGDISYRFVPLKDRFPIDSIEDRE